MTNLNEMSTTINENNDGASSSSSMTKILKRKNKDEKATTEKTTVKQEEGVTERPESDSNGVTLIQTRSCLELDQDDTDVESFSLCRDCDEAQDDEDSGSSSDCRFIGWRKLKWIEDHNRRRCLHVVGFLSPDEAQIDDIKLWSVETSTTKVNDDFKSLLSFETESQQAEAILNCVRKSFDDIVKYEIEMRNKYIKKDVTIWKRLMSETREMCDQCRTTLFNGHFACLTCGFAVCFHCYELKEQERNVKNAPKNHRELTNWYYCTKKNPKAKKSRTKYDHEPENLDIVQYIPPKVLDSVYSEFKSRTSCKEPDYGSPVKMPQSLSAKLDHSGHPFGEYLVADANDTSLTDAMLLESFQHYWLESKPLVVRNVNKRLREADAWTPHAFVADFGDLRVDLINCRNHRVLPSVPLADFWLGFEDESKRLRDIKARPMILKLKDWPTSDDFKHMMPQRFADLMDNLPVKEYTHRSGPFNLVSYLPQSFCLPDLGPKLYVAYSSAGTPKEGTTNLHVDISDAVNLLIYAAGDISKKKKEDKEEKEEKEEDERKPIDKEIIELVEKCGCSQDQLERLRSGEIPGALWHIFKPKDADEIRSFLVKDEIVKGKLPRANSDPIHDQINYIDDQMLQRLDKEHAVTPYTIVQFLGDAIFIPAGAPHQVRNLNSCIKVALDFVSPQGIQQCLLITDQLRHLSEKHVNREDKLQVKNIIYHTVKKTLSVLKQF